MGISWLMRRIAAVAAAGLAAALAAPAQARDMTLWLIGNDVGLPAIPCSWNAVTPGSASVAASESFVSG
jgi:hypothetical protein